MFAAQCRQRDAASRSPVFRSKGRPEEESGTMAYNRPCRERFATPSDPLNPWTTSHCCLYMAVIGAPSANPVLSRPPGVQSNCGFGAALLGAAQGYGNIMNVETDGASEETAQGDNLVCSGVEASHELAEMDSERMEKYRSIIKDVGKKTGVEPALIAAIISRESRAGNVLHNGWDEDGKDRKAFGLMQIDRKNSGLIPVGAWDSEEHLSQATNHLIDFIGVIGNKFPSWNSEQRLKGALAAYNMGADNVLSDENVDENTKHKDYSNDVVARAQWYKTKGGF